MRNLNKLMLLSVSAMIAMMGCKGKGQVSEAVTDDDLPYDSIMTPQDTTPQPVFVIARDDRSVMVHYWIELDEPVKTEYNASDFAQIHNEWSRQQQFRRCASQYTRLMMEDGSTCKVKYRAEQILNIDGDTIFPGELHWHPEIPNSGAFLDVADKKTDIRGMGYGVVVTDAYLKNHKPLPLSKCNNEVGGKGNSLPANIVKQLEQKYKMKASSSTLLRRIDNRYTFGCMQFKGEWKDAPKNENFHNVGQCLALDVLIDGEKTYIKERPGYYESENSYGWNVDDEGIYTGSPLIAAFEGNDGLTLCFYHPAVESFTVGIYATKDDQLVTQFSTCYHSMIDESIPVWKRDFAEMQRMYVSEEPGERRHVKFTKWADIFIDYASEFLWLKDEETYPSGAIFSRKDGQYSLITEVGHNRTPSRGEKQGVSYLCVSGSAGGPASYSEVYTFREGKVVDHFFFLEVEGELNSCTLNGKEISLEQGQAYYDNLPEFKEINAYFDDIKQ